MKYLFFDIECANYVNGIFTICTFGYTLTNTKFKVLDKKDILINPCSSFNKIVLHKIIHYKEEDFLNKPKFDEIYPYLKSLLLDKDTICFGYDVGNDLRFLNGECSRYNLEPLSFKAYDIQHIHKLINNLPSPLALNKAALTLNIDLDNFELHNSKNDAYITMLIAKELEKQTKINLKDLMLLSEHICIDSSNIINPNKTRNDELTDLIHKYENRNKAFSFCFSEKLEKEDKENDYLLIKSILDAGFNYTTRVGYSRVYISNSNDDPRDIKYENRKIKRPDKINKINKKELFNFIKNYKNENKCE